MTVIDSTPDKLKISKSHEDYLEAIVMLGGSPTNAVRAVDVAAKMGVSKASMHKAAVALQEQGMLDQPHYGGITLSDAGYAYGRKVLDRHNALSLFLEKALGLSAEVAEEEACLMEHAISDASFEKWMSYIDSLDLE